MEKKELEEKLVAVYAAAMANQDGLHLHEALLALDKIALINNHYNHEPNQK
jgi:hypothetical protein